MLVFSLKECVGYGGIPEVRVWYTIGVQHTLNGMNRGKEGL